MLTFGFSVSICELVTSSSQSAAILPLKCCELDMLLSKLCCRFYFAMILLVGAMLFSRAEPKCCMLPRGPPGPNFNNESGMERELETWSIFE